jgi:hypothetical protein
MKEDVLELDRQILFAILSLRVRYPQLNMPDSEKLLGKRKDMENQQSCPIPACKKVKLYTPYALQQHM